MLPHLRPDRPHYVYFGRSLLNPDAIKIGVSVNPEGRLSSLTAELMLTIRCASEQEAYSIETKIHDNLADGRIAGEWFTKKSALLAYNYYKFCDDVTIIRSLDGRRS